MIPFSASLHLRHAEAPVWGKPHSRRVRTLNLWIPLFLAWLILLPLLLLLFPILLIPGIVFGVNVLELYATIWRILSSLNNTLVEVDNEEVSLQLRIG